MELSYRKQDGYLVPDILPPQTSSEPLGKYALMRRKYLMDHRPALYNRMVMEGTLTNHLLEMDRMTREMVEQRLRQMQTNMMTEGTMPDKNSDPLGWTGVMNNLKNRAEEVVLPQTVYSN